jgi:hypothetical protein
MNILFQRHKFVNPQCWYYKLLEISECYVHIKFREDGLNFRKLSAYVLYVPTQSPSRDVVTSSLIFSLPKGKLLKPSS